MGVGLRNLNKNLISVPLPFTHKRLLKSVHLNNLFMCYLIFQNKFHLYSTFYFSLSPYNSFLILVVDIPSVRLRYITSHLSFKKSNSPSQSWPITKVSTS